MGVLKVNVGTPTVPDWRDIGCGGGATTTTATGWSFTTGPTAANSQTVEWRYDGPSPPTAAVDYVRRSSDGGNASGWISPATSGTNFATYSLTFTLPAGVTLTEFVVNDPGGTITELDWKAAVPGRLKLRLPDGTWVREKCDSDSAPITDDFNRSTSATVLGGPWSLYSTSGSLANIDAGIDTGKGYISRGDSVSGHATEGRAYIDATADFDMSITVSGSANLFEHGVMFRMAADGSCWQVNGSGLYFASAVSGNSYSLSALKVSVGATAGVVRVVAAGSAISVYFNGVLKGSVTDATNATQIRHGWYQQPLFAPSIRFDDFSITPVVTARPLKMWDGTIWQTVACMVPA